MRFDIIPSADRLDRGQFMPIELIKQEGNDIQDALSGTWLQMNKLA